VQRRSESSRKDSSNNNEMNTAELAEVGGSKYAEVAVPLHVSAPFVYRLPLSMRQLAQTGSRIVVPLGRKLVTGYIVALFDNLRADTSLLESDIKDAKEILDAVPPVTPELLELTRWVAEYYLAPWGEVIKAALPPGISPTIHPFLSITENGRVALSRLSSSDMPESKQRLLKLVDESAEISLAKVSNEFGNSQATRLARELEQDGLVEIRQRSGSNFVKAKFQRRVRLVETNEMPGEEDGRKLTETQLRVIEALKGRESLALAELLARAKVSSSSVTTLQKRNIVEVFEEKLRRDPLGDVTFEQHQDYE
jgi:primosomal protein N' (replication factor Y)